MVLKVTPCPIWINPPLPTSQQPNILGIFDLQNLKEHLLKMANAYNQALLPKDSVGIHGSAGCPHVPIWINPPLPTLQQPAIISAEPMLYFTTSY